MKTQKALQWTLIALTLVAAANCLKHMVRQDAWSALAFVLIKDLMVAIGVFYLYRKSLNANEASLSLRLLLMVSFTSDWAIVLLPK